MARRIKTLTAISVVLLPVAVALYVLLPPTPAAAVFIGMVFGFGGSIPVGIMLALWTERRRTPRTTVTVAVATMPDDQHCMIEYAYGRKVTVDLLEAFGRLAIDAPSGQEGV